MVGAPLPATGEPGALGRFRTLSIYQTPQPTGGWLRAPEPNARFTEEQEGLTAPAMGQAGVSAAEMEKPDPQPCRDPPTGHSGQQEEA